MTMVRRVCVAVFARALSLPTAPTAHQKRRSALFPCATRPWQSIQASRMLRRIACARLFKQLVRWLLYLPCGRVERGVREAVERSPRCMRHTEMRIDITTALRDVSDGKGPAQTPWCEGARDVSAAPGCRRRKPRASCDLLARSRAQSACKRPLGRSGTKRGPLQVRAC